MSGAPCLGFYAAEKLPATRWATRAELYQALDKSRRFLAANYVRSIKVHEAAAEACLSHFHFIRCFRALFGETPGEYLVSVRLEKACELLRTTSLEIAEIGASVGFAEPSSFSRTFRKNLGVTPGTWRKLSPRTPSIGTKA